MQLSLGLLISLIAAIFCTVAVAVALGVAAQPLPPPAVGSGVVVVPGRPPSLTGLVVTSGACVLAWVCLIVTFSRDRLLRRIAALQHSVMPVIDGLRAEIVSLRSNLATDRQRELADVEQRIAAITGELMGEYGEQRETEGYLRGMRVASTAQINVGELRTLRSVPPIS